MQWYYQVLILLFFIGAGLLIELPEIREKRRKEKYYRDYKKTRSDGK